MTQMPQKAASAWSGALAIEGKLLGASYKPIAYVGTQVVKGVNHIFIAEQTLIVATPERHIVLLSINEYDGNYSLVGIERVI